MPAQTVPILPQDGYNEHVISRHGPMLVNRNDQYVGASLRKYGEYSRGESDLFRRFLRPGMLVVEAGANIGVHTVELSRLAGPTGSVVAFEPQRIVFQTLCANLALNSCANVHAYQAAIGDHVGEITVPFHAPDSFVNFGGVSLVGATQGERVPLRTIDSFGLPACHLLKLDIEGMEVEALRGAAETIRQFRPLLYVENDRQERAGELVGLLASWDYQLYWHRPWLFPGTDNFAGDPENLFGAIVSSNVLCIPAELNIDIRGLERVTSPTA